MRHLAQISPIKEGSGLDWLVVTITPDKVFMAQIAAGNLTTIKLMVATFFIVIIVGLFLAYLVITPIFCLSEAARNLARGKWDQSTLQASRFAELNTLTSSFNFMAGQLRAMFDGLTQEVADRKLVKQTLQNQEINFRTFLNTIDEMLFVINMAGNIIWYNSAVDRKLGYSEDELMGKSVLTVHPPEWRDRAQNILDAMLRGETSSCPIPVITRDGRYLSIETRTHKGVWSGEKVLFSVTKDLSELKASEEKFARAFQTCPAPMTISTMDTRVFVDVNDAFLTTLGFRREEVIGKTTRQLQLFVDQSQADLLRDTILEQGWIRNLEAKIRTRAGEIRHGIMSSESLVLQDRSLILTVMKDITDRKRLQQIEPGTNQLQADSQHNGGPRSAYSEGIASAGMDTRD